MWILILMTLVNSVLHQQKVQNEYRVQFGVIQFGILDSLLAIGFLWALVAGSSTRSKFPGGRAHPIVIWVLVLMTVGGLFGILGGMLNGNIPKQILTAAREYFAMVACVYIGYRLVSTPQQIKRIAKVFLIAGFFTACALYWSFSNKSEQVSLTGALNPVREIITHWHSEGAALTALVMVFVVMVRFPLWRTTICVLVGIYCYIAYASALSRLGFVILIFGTASAFLLLPRGERLRKFIRSIVFMPILLFACWGALRFSDAAIGRDFAGKVEKHFMTLLPGSDTEDKAWDSRITGIVTEFAVWMSNPLMGQGFGVVETQSESGVGTFSYVATRHNGWTSTLAETGIFGFAGLATLVFATGLIGYRMVHARTDPIFVLIGAIGFFTGVIFFLRCSGTLAITSRAAVGFGLACGVLFRAREIEEVVRATAQSELEYDPYLDPNSGLLVPDYEWEMGHFGAQHI